MSRAVIMQSYGPEHLQIDRTLAAIIQVEGQEFDNIRASLADILKQFYVETATEWGLDLWEQMLDLTSYAGKPLDQRRSRIISKLRGMGTVTVNLIKNVAESYVYGTVEVTENPALYSFTIKFVDPRGAPPNLDDVKAAIEEIKPAHLAVEYQFTYLIYDELKASGHTYDQLLAHSLTYDQLITWKPA